MILIEINRDDSAVESRNVNTKHGPRTFYHQVAYLHRPGKAYPDRFRVPLPSPAEAYAPGRYMVAPASFKVGRFGDLEINRFDFQLVPAAAQSQQAEGNRS